MRGGGHLRASAGICNGGSRRQAEPEAGAGAGRAPDTRDHQGRRCQPGGGREDVTKVAARPRGPRRVQAPPPRDRRELGQRVAAFHEHGGGDPRTQPLGGAAGGPDQEREGDPGTRPEGRRAARPGRAGRGAGAARGPARAAQPPRRRTQREWTVHTMTNLNGRVGRLETAWGDGDDRPLALEDLVSADRQYAHGAAFVLVGGEAFSRAAMVALAAQADRELEEWKRERM